jgi:hypothetical protein
MDSRDLQKMGCWANTESGILGPGVRTGSNHRASLLSPESLVNKASIKSVMWLLELKNIL